jgi:prepilin-type N-terminal cleavage/methylation domain-containing protein
MGRGSGGWAGRVLRTIRLPRPARDSGFTLAEVMVSMSLISITMAAFTPFFVGAMAVTDYQRTRQVAIQLAGDAVERARALNGSALLTGRGLTASTAQWAGAPAPVRPYLDTLSLAWDTDPLLAAGAGAAAPLPTAAVFVPIGGKRYEQQWYLGRCRQQGGPTGGADRPCTPFDEADPDLSRPDVPMFGLVVTVTWTHRTCPADRCVYVASTMFSVADDPVFNTERPPPTVNVGDQYSYVGSLVSMQLTATGGYLPLSWTVSGLPPGLAQLAAGSSVVSGTPTTVGAFTVNVTATDRALDSDSGLFTWHVGRPPALANPGSQESAVGTAVSVPFAGYRTYGHAAFVWTATGLPTGLTIDAATGVVSGTPTTARPPRPVTLTVTDRTGLSASAVFDWTVRLGLTIATQTTLMGTNAADFAKNPVGGQAPYTWAADNLPKGLVINSSTGVISGIAQHGTRYLTTVRVTDAQGAMGWTTFVWNVPPNQSNDMRIIRPDPASPDQSTRTGVSVSLTVEADRGSGSGYTWVATGLPPGLSIAQASSSTARVSGTAGAPGRYTATIVATDSNAKEATIMFVWTVTP